MIQNWKYIFIFVDRFLVRFSSIQTSAKFRRRYLSSSGATERYKNHSSTSQSFAKSVRPQIRFGRTKRHQNVYLVFLSDQSQIYQVFGFSQLTLDIENKRISKFIQITNSRRRFGSTSRSSSSNSHLASGIAKLLLGSGSQNYRSCCALSYSFDIWYFLSFPLHCSSVSISSSTCTTCITKRFGSNYQHFASNSSPCCFYQHLAARAVLAGPTVLKKNFPKKIFG